ncbi:hypothetical protein Ancab_036443, partial [Ancistrocladus abbreviatus]
ADEARWKDACTVRSTANSQKNLSLASHLEGLVSGEHSYKEVLVSHTNGAEAKSSSIPEKKSQRLGNALHLSILEEDLYWLDECFVGETMSDHISGSIRIIVDGGSFIVIVFEESMGETIFSKGFDWLGVANPNFLAEDKSISDASCHCSIAQHSPENCISGNKKEVSNELALNNDSFSCKSSLGKTNR